MSEPESGPKSEPSRGPGQTEGRRKALLRERIIAGAILGVTFVAAIVISKVSGDTATSQSPVEDE